MVSAKQVDEAESGRDSLVCTAGPLTADQVMATVLETLFPKTVDNVFPGPKLALWVFNVLTTVVICRSLVHILKDDGGAQSIASVPLDEMTEDGKAAVISIFAQWGLSQLVTALLFLVSCVRYRSLIPLMCLIFIAENIGRGLVGSIKPLPTEHSPPGAVGSIVFFLAACGILVAALHPSPRCAPSENLDSKA